MIKNLINFLAILLLLPQSSIQQSSTQGLCVYQLDNFLRYSCTLHNAQILNPSDVLEITGTHQTGRTDADVLAIYFQNVTLRFLNGEIMRKFTNLQAFFSFRIGTEVIHQNAFEVCGRLEILEMQQTQIHEFPSQMLRNCVNLRHFDVRGSENMNAVPGDLFDSTQNLENFIIHGQRLTTIPDNLLTNMRNLRTFNIAMSSVSQLSPNNFRNAVNLEFIDISWNEFNNRMVVMDVLNGHARLRNIIITGNRFPMFDFRFFSQFTELQQLSIDTAPGQSLTSISWLFLPASLTTLKVVQIGENIPENAFFNLQNLTSLELKGNGITMLHANTFRQSTALMFLTITGTLIRILPSQLFAAQANLRLLWMNTNQIEELPDGIFAPLVSLGLNVFGRSLRLSGNRIQRLSTDLFSQHPHLRSIDFSFNQIDGIQRGLFSRLSDRLDAAHFLSNRCVNELFLNKTGLDEDARLETCFNNFDGIGTTTQATTSTTDGCGSEFYNFKIFGIIFAVINILLY